MLQSDRIENGMHGYGSFSSVYAGTPSNQRSQSASDLSDLDALLPKDLSPNKRAVIETLVKLWGESPRV